MKRSRLIMSVTIVVVVLVVCGAGYISWAKLARGTNETRAGTEPNKPGEVQKPGDANEPEKVAEAEKPGDANEPNKAAETEKPGDANDVERERPERGPMTERTGRRGRSRTSPEERESMRGRFQNMSEEERQAFREQMRERFGGERRPGGRERVRDPNDPNAPGDPNAPSDPNAPGEPNEPSEPIDPNNILEALNLKDVAMKDVIKKLADWTGKVIIPADDAMKVKITIYSAKKLPRRQALLMIYTALRAKGIVAEYTDNVIELKAIKDVKIGPVPTVAAGQALAMIENKKQVVQTFFKLVNYSPSQMGQVVQPLIGEHGYVSADETTGQLLVIDTVENLMRIERIIAVFDVSDAGRTIQKVFEIRYGDPAEIVQLLRILLSGEGSSGSRSIRAPSRGGMRPSSSRPGSSSQSGTSGSATSVVIGPSQMPVILIPEQNRRWIIARASPEDMKLIDEWITRLDREEPIKKDYETIPITYADVSEVASRLNEVLQDFPGQELKASVLVQPLVQARQIMVFGRADRREMVKKLIEEIDIPPGELETKVFKLKHADPDQIKQNLDSLYGETDASGRYDYNYYRYGRTPQSPAEMVKVIAFPTMQQVTVIASPVNMRKIEKQIEEWDVPLDVEKVKPLIISLRNSDPVQMANLLMKLFSETTSGSGRDSYLSMILGYGYGQQDQQKIVGPLYGQLTFEPVPGTKKIIVISKMPEAYKVIEELIRELDTQEMAEIPKVITLNYADPEELAERLNAMFNEPGTVATFRRTQQGLSEYSMEEEGSGGNGSGNQATSADEVRPWWGQGYRGSLDEMPISNVIGRIRFVPDPHTKSILVLSPPEFIENIEELIRELDVPGKQVMIKATIMEVEHSSMTSLGLQLATNAADAFGTLEENAITALTSLTFLETYGSLTLNAATDVTALVDFLVKKVDAKILNQQTLWTKDNEEADFFKGDKVAFQTDATISDIGTRVTSSFEFERVGMTLRARPSITPENKVDMILNVILSQLTGENVNAQPVRTEMETTTNMIVQDGQTVMLGGILFQKDSIIERKLPLIGDVPLVGPLFRHTETIAANNELIVFITPYVIDEPGNMLPETKEELEDAKEKLDSVLKQLQATLGTNKKAPETP